MDEVDRLVIGFVPHREGERDARVRSLTRALQERTGVYVVERAVTSYDELSEGMILGRIHVAWLPPLVFSKLERDRVAVGVATRVEGAAGYWSALVTRSSSPIDTLDAARGARVAWVDRLSSSGYVIARLGLLARDFDPRSAFAHEIFTGSHAESLRALLEGRADVAATFVHVDGAGRVIHGPWREMGRRDDEFRVLESLGQIPPDVLAVRTSVPEAMRDVFMHSMLELAADAELGPVVASIFGTRRFTRGTTASYAALCSLIDRVSGARLDEFGGSAYVSTAPPPSDR